MLFALSGLPDLHLQALEAAMPESTDGLMEVISAHVEGGSSHGHAIVQLLEIAASCAVRHPLTAENLNFEASATDKWVSC